MNEMLEKLLNAVNNHEITSTNIDLQIKDSDRDRVVNGLPGVEYSFVIELCIRGDKYKVSSRGNQLKFSMIEYNDELYEDLNIPEELKIFFRKLVLEKLENFMNMLIQTRNNC